MAHLLHILRNQWAGIGTRLDASLDARTPAS